MYQFSPRVPPKTQTSKTSNTWWQECDKKLIDSDHVFDGIDSREDKLHFIRLMPWPKGLKLPPANSSGEEVHESSEVLCQCEQHIVSEDTLYRRLMVVEENRRVIKALDESK